MVRMVKRVMRAPVCHLIPTTDITIEYQRSGTFWVDEDENDYRPFSVILEAPSIPLAPGDNILVSSKRVGWKKKRFQVYQLLPDNQLKLVEMF